MKFILEFLIIIILLKIAWQDKKTYRIPDPMLIALGFSGMIFRCVEGGVKWEECVAGICGASILLLMVSFFKPGSFGGGDVKLMAVSGLILGGERNLYALFWGMAVAGVYCILMMNAGRIDRKSKIALGPFLCVGVLWEFVSHEAEIMQFF